MLRIGLIGCGGIGAVHARCWMALNDSVKLIAIAHVDTERAKEFANKADAKVYADGFEMLEREKLDVVDICVPTFLHATYVLEAMERVRNVIIEKPICLTEQEAEMLLEIQRKTGTLVQVAHVVRFMNPYRWLKDLVDSGKYGSLVAGRFSRISPRPMWMKGHDDINRTGTMTIDMHIHDVDYIRYLMGKEPDDMEVWSVKDSGGVIQHVCSSYRFGGALLIAEGSWNYPSEFPFSQTFRVRLEKAAVVLDENGILTVYPEDAEKIIRNFERDEETDLEINVSDITPYMSELRCFVKAIQEGNKEGVVPLKDAVDSLRSVLKEMQSAKEN